jgi:hypothetical protein
VTVTATNVNGKTLLQLTNDPSSTSGIVSLTVEIKNGNFKSFTLGNGWVGKRTSFTTIAFFSSSPIKPGDSTTFTISTDQPAPDLVWMAYGANNNRLDTGEIGAVIQQSQNNNNQSKNQGVNNTVHNNSSTPIRGILDTSVFRIIPSTPAPGFDVRVVGQSFTSSIPLYLYMGSQQIDSFTSDSNGNFVVTTTIPQTVQPGSVDFVLRDQANNQKTFTTTIETPTQPRVKSPNSIQLTVNADVVLHPGDTEKITGTANPDSTVTFSILNSNGTSITSFTANADRNGNYVTTRIVPNDAPFGKYTVSITDGNHQLTKDFTVTSAHRLAIFTSQTKYNAGDTVVINGTSISNIPVSIVVVDETASQVFAKDVNVTGDGKFSTSYTISNTAIVGTYTITASQGSDQVSLNIGMGVDPSALLSASLDKLNYENTEKPMVSISAPHDSTLNLVVIDPSDQEKFSDIIQVGQDGFTTYSFNLTSYTPGIYSLALTRGNDKIEKNFAVGLPTGCGQISLRTVKDAYFPGDNLLIFGNANANCIIEVSLTDPNGLQSKTKQAFVDKQGIFSAFDFRIPDDGIAGNWKLDATSGIDHKSIPIVVRSKATLTIELDKSPPNYSTGDLVKISGSGVGELTGVTVKILGASNTPIETFQIQSTNRGDYDAEWLIPSSFNPGSYTVQVSSVAGKVTSPITIQ